MRGGVVLDIGTLYANNLIPFYERGFKCFATEVTKESVEIAKKSAISQKIKCEILLGFNTDLPFQNNSFDIVLSLSTIHYEESIDSVKKAFREFKRILKPGGSLILQTCAPKHNIFVKSTKIKEYLYQLNSPSDIRHGQNFIFFDKVEKLIEITSNFFCDIQVARCTEEYPKSCVDVWLLKCKN